MRRGYLTHPPVAVKAGSAPVATNATLGYEGSQQAILLGGGVLQCVDILPARRGALPLGSEPSVDLRYTAPQPVARSVAGPCDHDDDAGHGQQHRRERAASQARCSLT